MQKASTGPGHHPNEFSCVYGCKLFHLKILYKTVQDYIHRVGRTARAGRSGVAISLVNQYELEWYIQIEKLIGMWHLLYSLEGVRDLRKVPIFIIYTCHVPGKKLPEFPAEEEDVLLLLQRVTEAKRISQMV